ncbi:MAG: hypothetical protein WA383_15870 [Terriglobales bacterium]
METKESRRVPTSEITAFLLCGTLLILVGAASAGGGAVIALDRFERLLPSSTDNPGGVDSNELIAWVVASIAAVGYTVLGFFIARREAMPFWYKVVSGYLPGFLLFQGWAAIHAGLAAKKGLQVHGLRRVIMLSAVFVGLPLAIFVHEVFFR